MITHSIFRFKATLSLTYLILYTTLGIYFMFTRPDQAMDKEKKVVEHHARFSASPRKM